MSEETYDDIQEEAPAEEAEASEEPGVPEDSSVGDEKSIPFKVGMLLDIAGDTEGQVWQVTRIGFGWIRTKRVK